jgi:O-antigen/teichoic acid export membrane protein
MSAEPQGSLKSRIFKAGGWNILQLFLVNVMRVGSNLIMTRLLVPEAFGLMSFVMVVVTAFTLMSDIGLQRSVIRDPDGDTKEYLRAAWVVQIWRSSFIGLGVLTLSAALYAFGQKLSSPGTVYSDPTLPLLLASITAVPILDGLKSTNFFVAQRNFHNGKLAFFGVSSQLFAIIVQILCAAIWHSVWSLIIGTISGQLLRTITSHFFFDGPTMKWRPNREVSVRLWSFGKYLMGSSSLTFISRNTDKFLLASLLGSSSFGLYAVAQIWISSIETLITRLTDHIGFSAIGEVLRNRPKDASRAFRKLQKAMDLICATAFISTFLMSETFINILYPENFQKSGEYLSTLSLVFLAMRFNAFNMLILNHGDSRSLMFISGIRAATAIIFLPVSYNLIGIEGALLAVALTPLSSAPYTIWLIRPLLGEGYAARQVLWVVAILLAAVAVYLTY